jgi:hypothetical protein
MNYHADLMTKVSIIKAWFKRVVYSIKLGSECPFLRDSIMIVCQGNTPVIGEYTIRR